MATIMENGEIRTSLEEQIAAQIEELNNYAPGSEEYKASVEAINKLYRLGIDETLAEGEYNEKIETREETTRLKEKEIELRERELNLNEEKANSEGKREVAKIAVNASISIAALAANVALIKEGFKFEETGVIRSTSMRNLLSKLGNIFKK